MHDPARCCRYRRVRSELSHEGEFGAVAVVVEGLGVGIALLADEREAGIRSGSGG